MNHSTAICLATEFPGIRGAVECYLSGDHIALDAIRDFIEERGLIVFDIKPGECWLICTQTMYYVGRVRSTSFGSIVLEDCSWVHRTGRLGELLATGVWNRQRSNIERIPDGTIVATANVISFYPWKHPLPKESF